MSEENILRSLRGQAWERAKGELRAMLPTFYDGDVPGASLEGGELSKFEKLDRLIAKFIEDVEGDGLYE